jgi:hypothetical protein
MCIDNTAPLSQEKDLVIVKMKDNDENKAKLIVDCIRKFSSKLRIIVVGPDVVIKKFKKKR